MSTVIDNPPEVRTLWPGTGHAMAFCRIPPGKFRMGSRGQHSSEEPLHWVEITQPFWLGQTPVTQAQYRWLVEATCVDLDPVPSYFKNQDIHPVENVSWEDCRQLIKGLNGMAELEASLVGAGLPGDSHFRLPTEAEWEYACRAGTETEYHTGDGEAALGRAGWYRGNSGTSTHPVGQKKPNEFGLYDMHGNVLEWCLDGWDATAYAKRPALVSDPPARAREEGSPRVFRGGSWCLPPGFCRSAIRGWRRPGDRLWDRGFRLCLSSGPVGGAPSTGNREAEPASGAGGSGADDQATRAGSAGGEGTPEPTPWAALKPPRSGPLGSDQG
jgi:formylglycine-generating enzyme required for sulfatase activity